MNNLKDYFKMNQSSFICFKYCYLTLIILFKIIHLFVHS